jgi:hypothetical protein
MVAVSYKRKKRTIVDNAKALDAAAAGGVHHVHADQPKVFAEGSLDKLAHDNEYQHSEHVVDSSTKHYLPVEPNLVINTPVDIPPALATQHEGQPLRLTDLAHEYNLEAYERLIKKSEGYKAMTVDHSSMSLELALFVLAGRNGADHAKRMHLLELVGGTWSWVNTGREESKAKDGSDKEQDLYLAWLGTTFLVGARATLTWKAGIEFRLALHRSEHEESKTTKI